MPIMSSEEIKSARQSQKKKSSGNQSWHVTTHSGKFSSNPKNNIRKVGLKTDQEKNGSQQNSTPDLVVRVLLPRPGSNRFNGYSFRTQGSKN